jgi:maleylpyruvate isomerase
VLSHPPALAEGPEARARVRALAQAIACDIHPLCNLRVLQFLTGPLEHSESQKLEWIRHWVTTGLASLESWLTRDGESGSYCHGDEVTLADICLIPQVFNARRFECPMENLPKILSIYDACMALPAFASAAPHAQPDAA